jgi:hypothetical protein
MCRKAALAALTQAKQKNRENIMASIFMKYGAEVNDNDEPNDEEFENIQRNLLERKNLKASKTKSSAVKSSKKLIKKS